MRLRAPRWSRLGPPALALLAVLTFAASAGAAYQGSVYANRTAFSTCDGTGSTIPTKLRALATSGFQYLGYSTSAFDSVNFSKSRVLSRVAADAGFYVFSHGDHYYAGWGFRVDNGSCSQAVVTGNEIRAKRINMYGWLPTANLVIASTCHLGEAASTFPDAFGIARQKSTPAGGNYQGRRFFLGYVGTAWTIDMLAFETAFWARVKTGHNLGEAFDYARRTVRMTYATVPNWYGTYLYSGVPWPPAPCTNCE